MPGLAIAPVILIAEAEPWAADLLVQLVRDVRPDASICQARDGAAALAQCKRQLPALIIADGQLPGVNGLFEPMTPAFGERSGCVVGIEINR